MCFSAEASFAASGTLAVTGIAVARLPKKKSAIPLSMCPLIFAAHQFIEGILWLEHSGTLPEEYKSTALYAFVFIAFILWPIYIPLCCGLIEKGGFRKNINRLCLLIGIYAGLSALVGVLQHPVDATVVGHSFAYDIELPPNFLGFYAFAVITPFLISSQKGLVIFGMALTVFCGIALYSATSNTFPSVWCFLAALLSLGLYLHFRHEANALAQRENSDMRHHP